MTNKNSRKKYSNETKGLTKYSNEYIMCSNETNKTPHNRRKERIFMKKKEKKEEVLKIAEMFRELDEKDKIFINGYLTGKREERAKWERKPA